MEEKDKKQKASALAGLLDDVGSSEVLPVPEDLPEDVKQALQEPEVDNKIYSYAELIAKYKAMPSLPRYSTGFGDIDELLDGGMSPGEVMVLAAPTKSGKTLFSQNMSFNQASRSDPVASLWFTLELSWYEFIGRMMEMDKFLKYADVFSDLPIYCPINNRDFSVGKVRDRIIEIKRSHDIKYVYIDHLHFLLGLDKLGEKNTSFVMGAIMRELKRLAVEQQVCLVVISHVKKMPVDSVPDLDSIRDSSFIAQESDFTLIIWRERVRGGKKDILDNDSEEVFTGRTYVSLEAARRGKTQRMIFGVHEGQFFPWRDMERLTSETIFDRPAKEEKKEEKEKQGGSSPTHIGGPSYAGQTISPLELVKEEKASPPSTPSTPSTPLKNNPSPDDDLTEPEREQILQNLFKWDG